MMLNAGLIVLGLLAGTLHFALLRWNTALYARPGGIGLGAALQAARIGTLGGVLLAVVQLGALPLLLVTLGVVIARPAVMRWMAAAP